jgi:trans-2,3-dihydro-3-hydroxyanthranilate isomerase
MNVQSSRRLPYVLMDVFSSKPLEGNQLAVFTDAHGLSDDEMQSLAREMNRSETTFVFSPAHAKPDDPVPVRIFTVAEELPFAGHPTLGTATVIRGASRASKVTLDLKVGHIPVTFEDRPDGVFGEMRQRDPEFGPTFPHAEVAAAIGLKPEDLDSSLPVQSVSTGVPFAIMCVRRLQTLQTFQLDWRRVSEYLSDKEAKFFYMVCRETVDPAARLHARMIFYNGEDPATGSAAGCCAAWAAAYGVAPSGERVLIEQGMEMKRPSRIFVRADKTGDRVTNVRVGGYAVEVARGEVRL